MSAIFFATSFDRGESAWLSLQPGGRGVLAARGLSTGYLICAFVDEWNVRHLLQGSVMRITLFKLCHVAISIVEESISTFLLAVLLSPFSVDKRPPDDLCVCKSRTVTCNTCSPSDNDHSQCSNSMLWRDLQVDLSVLTPSHVVPRIPQLLPLSVARLLPGLSLRMLQTLLMASSPFCGRKNRCREGRSRSVANFVG